ncbi:MAG: class I SAM-dependent methyltransferase [Nanoarchaeota archaeon]
MTSDFNQELSVLWEKCTDALFDKVVYVNRLEELLRSYGVTEESLILDVAGGFGFPVIDLAKRGYSIVFNDGSQAMFERAMFRAKEERAPGYIFQYDSFGARPWQDFGDLSEEMWKALICKGNSLPYAVSWGKAEPNLERAREEIKSALANFYRILEYGGILYVDKQPEAQEQAVEEIGEVEIDGQRMYLTCSFDNDKVRRVRNWTLTTKNQATKEKKDYPSQGYLLLEEELVSLLNEVGFKKVEKHILEGDIYEAFVAVK